MSTNKHNCIKHMCTRGFMAPSGTWGPRQLPNAKSVPAVNLYQIDFCCDFMFFLYMPVII